jgi:hypothetical protein
MPSPRSPGPRPAARQQDAEGPAAHDARARHGLTGTLVREPPVRPLAAGMPLITRWKIMSGHEPYPSNGPRRSLTRSLALLPPRSRARRSCAPERVRARRPCGAAVARRRAPPCPEAPPGRPQAFRATSSRASPRSRVRGKHLHRSVAAQAGQHDLQLLRGRPTSVPASLAQPRLLLRSSGPS